jgi:hypothetical protein
MALSLAPLRANVPKLQDRARSLDLRNLWCSWMISWLIYQQFSSEDA